VWFRIRRLKCKECGKLHRELPDILLPYKHYRSEIIEEALDGKEEAPGPEARMKRSSRSSSKMPASCIRRSISARVPGLGKEWLMVLRFFYVVGAGASRVFLVHWCAFPKV